MNIQSHTAESWGHLANDFLSRRTRTEPGIAALIREGGTSIIIGDVEHRGPKFGNEAKTFVRRIRDGAPTTHTEVLRANGHAPVVQAPMAPVRTNNVADGSDLVAQLERFASTEPTDAQITAELRSLVGSAPAAPPVTRSITDADSADGSGLVDALNRALLDDIATPMTQKPRQSVTTDDGAALLSALEGSL